ASLAGAPRLDVTHVHGVLARRRGLGEEGLGLTPRPREFFDQVAARIGERGLGQAEVVARVADVLWSRSQLAPSRARPGVRGSALCSGPTGVGKTEVARATADALHKGDRFIRIDASALREQHEIARLVGAPPGYVGHGMGGELTNAIREKGYGVVCIDEI